MYEDLFTLDDWKVRGTEFPKRYHASHTACSTGGSLSWIIEDSSAVCVHCGTPVPDEIQGLILMLVNGYNG